MRKHLIICLIITLIGNTAIKAQFCPISEYPEIGQPMPDFALKNVKYFNKTNVSLEDFRGKWLIVDFWSKYCPSCINAMPEVNRIEAEFKEKVQVILICCIWREGGEQQIYDRLRQKEQLDLPVAFDSLISDKFNIGGLPKYIIVDPSGIVRGITYHIESRDIKDFIDGRTPNLPSSYIGPTRPPKKFFDKTKPLLIDGNGGTDTSYAYRAVITRWSNGAYYQASMRSQLLATPNRIDITNFPLRYLYFYSFTGHDYAINYDDPDYRKFFPAVVIEVKDSLLFRYPIAENNTFSFSLTMPSLSDPEQNVDQFKTAMQNELKNYFGYNARLESKVVPCYKLVSMSNETLIRLKSKGGTTSRIDSKDLMTHTYTNVTMTEFVKSISKIHLGTGPIIVDSTNIHGNIDIKLENALYNIYDWDNLILALRRNGLDIQMGEIEMKVLVIGDRHFN